MNKEGNEAGCKESDAVKAVEHIQKHFKDKHEELTKLLAEAKSEAVPEVSYWLIESAFSGGQTNYWNGLPDGSGQSFLPDVNAAVKFPTREDAEKVAQHMHRIRVCEHVWLTAAPQPETDRGSNE